MSLQPSTDGSSSRALEKVPAAQKREELRAGVRDCRNRGLYQAAKWASEQLAGKHQGSCTYCGDRSRSWLVIGRSFAGLPASEDAERQSALRSQGTALSEDSDSLLLARTLFDAKVLGGAAYDCMRTVASRVVAAEKFLILILLNLYAQEYRRAASALKNVGGNASLFLRLYSLYLAGERRKE